MTSIRAFFGLGLAQAKRPLKHLCEQLHSDMAANAADQRHWQALRWLPPHNYHVTLVFLGDIRSSDVNELQLLSEPLASHCSPLSLKFDQVSWFPAADRPKVLALLPECSTALMSLQAALSARLKAAGFAVTDNPYRPHISLARINRRRINDTTRGQFQCERVANIRINIEQFALFSSTPGPGASIYTPLFTQTLTGSSILE